MSYEHLWLLGPRNKTVDTNVVLGYLLCSHISDSYPLDIHIFPRFIRICV